MTEAPDDDAAVVHRTLDTDAENPAVAVAEVVAELEDEAVADLTPTYSCIDDVLEHLFSTPPAMEAQMEVRFTYEGYRVTVYQNGRAKFVATDRGGP